MTTQSENNKIYIKKEEKSDVNPAHSESTQAKKKKQPAFLTQKEAVKKIGPVCAEDLLKGWLGGQEAHEDMCGEVCRPCVVTSVQ